MSCSASAGRPAPPAGAARVTGRGAAAGHSRGMPLASYGSGKGAGPAPTPLPPNRGMTWADDWPLRDALELAALPTAVPCARLHARQMLWEWKLTVPAENAELLVSELMTNAIAASRSLKPILPVRLWLLSDRRQVLILVWDASPQPPVPVNTTGDAEHGRGLLLVQEISKHWGCYAARDTGGKVVWAICET
jgi:anti-sigma regulatory factor (Ser/Thr protein kinase)